MLSLSWTLSRSSTGDWRRTRCLRPWWCPSFTPPDSDLVRLCPDFLCLGLPASPSCTRDTVFECLLCLRGVPRLLPGWLLVGPRGLKPSAPSLCRGLRLLPSPSLTPCRGLRTLAPSTVLCRGLRSLGLLPLSSKLWPPSPSCNPLHLTSWPSPCPACCWPIGFSFSGATGLMYGAWCLDGPICGGGWGPPSYGGRGWGWPRGGPWWCGR